MPTHSSPFPKGCSRHWQPRQGPPKMVSRRAGTTAATSCRRGSRKLVNGDEGDAADTVQAAFAHACGTETESESYHVDHGWKASESITPSIMWRINRRTRPSTRSSPPPT